MLVARKMVRGGACPRTIFLAAMMLVAMCVLVLPFLAHPALSQDIGIPVGGDGAVDGAVDGTDIAVQQGGQDTSSPDVPHANPPTVETPPKAHSATPHALPDGTWALLVVLGTIGAMSTWVPGEVRRMRIETAWRASNEGRLLLARREFAGALRAFDVAIEEAHAAYTRRVGPGEPVDWRLLPDTFYINLWRGRAAALRGLGRVRAAEFTDALARELEATVAAAAVP